MRSTPSRRLHSRPPRHPVRSSRPHGPAEERLQALARLVDQATLDEPGHAAVHASTDAEDLVLGVLPLEPEVHPFPQLAGTRAPEDWEVFGLRVRGAAHHLTDGRRTEGTATTFVVDRSGAEWSVLRCGDELTDLAGPAVGTLPDLCRRILALPTEPAPPSTALLFVLAWFDRAVDAWGDPVRQHLSSSWPRLAALHPAIAPGTDPSSLSDPQALVTAARAHAAAWSWSRLRAEPSAAPLPPGNELPLDITAWMDDGFYARWALGSFPPAAQLVHDLAGLVAPEVRAPLLAAAAGLLP